MTNLDAFVVSGNDDKIHKLKALIEKRQLSNEDLALMLILKIITMTAAKKKKRNSFSLTLKQLVVKPSYQKEKTRSRPSAWMKNRMAVSI